jgi:hypothetical protein
VTRKHEVPQGVRELNRLREKVSASRYELGREVGELRIL